jgi:hypothetical protein
MAPGTAVHANRGPRGSWPRQDISAAPAAMPPKTLGLLCSPCHRRRDRNRGERNPERRRHHRHAIWGPFGVQCGYRIDRRVLGKLSPPLIWGTVGRDSSNRAPDLGACVLPWAGLCAGWFTVSTSSGELLLPPLCVVLFRPGSGARWVGIRCSGMRRRDLRVRSWVAVTW